MRRLGIRTELLADAAARGLHDSELGWLVSYILRRQLAAAAKRSPHVDRSSTVVLTVGFADLVGFTSLRVALRLRDDARATGIPDMRAGLARGRVLAYAGDYYGPVVNLASRLATEAHHTLDLKGIGTTPAWKASSASNGRAVSAG